MKTDEEMMASLLKRAEVYQKERKRKMKIYSGSLLSLILVVVCVLPSLGGFSKKADGEKDIYTVTSSYPQESGNFLTTENNSINASNQTLIALENIDLLNQDIREAIENKNYQDNEIVQLNDNEYFTVVEIDGEQYVIIGSNTDYSSFVQMMDQYNNVVE